MRDGLVRRRRPPGLRFLVVSRRQQQSEVWGCAPDSRTEMVQELADIGERPSFFENQSDKPRYPKAFSRDFTDLASAPMMVFREKYEHRRG